MKTVKPLALSAIKTVRRTPEHFNKELGAVVQATTTKKITLTLLTERWEQLEFLSKRIGWDAVSEIEAAINHSREFGDRVRLCETRDAQRQSLNEELL